MVQFRNYCHAQILTIHRGNAKQVVVFSFYFLPSGDSFTSHC